MRTRNVSWGMIALVSIVLGVTFLFWGYVSRNPGWNKELASTTALTQLLTGDINLTSEWQGIEVPVGYQFKAPLSSGTTRCDIRANKDPSREHEIPLVGDVRMGENVWYVEWRLHPNEQAQCKVHWELIKP